MGSNARRILLVSNTIAMLVSGIMLGGTAYLFYGPTDNNIEAYVALVPEWAFYTLMSLFAAIMIVTIVGCGGALYHNKCLLSVFAVILLLLLIAEVTVASVLSYNYFVATPTGTVGEYVNSATELLEDQFVTFAINAIPTWVLLQTDLQCCGFNFRASYDTSIKSKDEDLKEFFSDYIKDKTQLDSFLLYRDALNSGYNCTDEGNQYMYELIENSKNEYSATVQSLADKSPLIGKDTDYFCENVIIEQVEPYYLYLAIGAGSIGFTMLSSIIAAFKLLCCTSTEDGGYQDVYYSH